MALENLFWEVLSVCVFLSSFFCRFACRLFSFFSTSAFSVFLLSVSCLSLNGCRLFLEEDQTCLPVCQDPSVVLDDQSSEERLVSAAESIDKSLNTLAAAQQAKSPPVLRIGPLITPAGGMGEKADIDWVGPIGPLLDKIACMTDYRVKTLGEAPAIPIVVSITSKNTVIAEILQNASLQAGQRTQILVYPENRVIELRYLQ